MGKSDDIYWQRWQKLLEAAANFQELLTGSVMIGGSAAAVHIKHQFNYLKIREIDANEGLLLNCYFVVKRYLDRPGAPASGRPQDQHLCRQLVLILLNPPTKQHKKFALDTSCF